MCGRQLHSVYDALRPKKTYNPTRNVAMEESFNRRHGAKERLFNVGDAVYVRDYRNGHPNASAGIISSRRSKVSFEVALGAEH